MYYSDEDAFKKEILPELGIMQNLEQFRLIKILQSKSKPTDEIYAIFNFLDGNHLAVKDEEEAIHKNMRKSPFFYFAYKMRRGDEIYVKLHNELVAHQECKVVHFGMHGSSIDTFVTDSLAFCLKESSVKCITLNMCKSEPMANDLRKKAKIEKVIYWISDVNDNAASAFSEAFYYYLCVKEKKNYLEFRKAFESAIKSLGLRGYLLIDPANKEELEQKKKDNGRPDLVAAGIPKFYDRSQEQEADHTFAAARIPDTPSYASRNANSSPSTAATQQDMDVDGTNASEQENPRNWREEPLPSSNSTPMASRQPYNQNSFSQSDILSSKKRRRDGNDVERNSDNASIAYAQESPSVPNQNVGYQNQNNTSRAMRDYQSPKCQLRCNYIFTECTSTPSHTIVSNCQYIDYHPESKCHTKGVKSLQHDIRKCQKRGKCNSKNTVTKCEECGIYYCSVKKVPSEGSSVVDKSCLDVHVCTSELKDKPDITIRIKHRNCEECNKASENTTKTSHNPQAVAGDIKADENSTKTSPVAGGNEFGNVATNFSSESGIMNVQIPMNLPENNSLHNEDSSALNLLDTFEIDSTIGNDDDISIKSWEP